MNNMNSSAPSHAGKHDADGPRRSTGAPIVTSPLFRFEFQREYAHIYTNRHERFVLRDEHVAELKRLVNEHYRDRAPGCAALSMSDIVNSALDFVLEHPKAFHSGANPDNLRDSIAREVYAKAFLHFLRHGIV